MSQEVTATPVSFVPLKPYVDELIRKLGVPKDGEDIEVAKMETALGMERSNARFATIVARWKETLRINHGIIIVCKRGQGCYHACDDDEKVDEACRRKGNAEREVERTVLILNCVDAAKLSDDNAIVFDKLRLNMQKRKLELAQAVK